MYSVPIELVIYLNFRKIISTYEWSKIYRWNLSDTTRTYQLNFEMNLIILELLMLDGATTILAYMCKYKYTCYFANCSGNSNEKYKTQFELNVGSGK